MKEFLTRHSIKPKEEDPESLDYKGISERGVELAREKAEFILSDFEKEEPGTVLFLAGASNIIRTKSTSRVYGDEIKSIVQEKEMNDIEVISEEDLGSIESYSRTVNDVVDRISSSPDKKFIINTPLFVKEFSQKPWLNDDGSYSDFTNKLLERNNNNEEACLRDWIKNGGMIDGIQGPIPEDIAKKHIGGTKRLRNFVEENLRGRKIIIGSVGHSWNLDALAIYLANNGVVDIDGYEKINGEMINETEAIKIELDEDGTEKVLYRGKEIKINS